MGVSVAVTISVSV